MNRFFLHIVLAICLAVSIDTAVNAQVVSINMDALMSTQTSTMSGTFVDKETGEPLSFASVYLQPAKDTIITNFSLSDKDGKVVIDEIAAGRYKITAEYVGYRPYTREYLFTGGRGLDLGTVKMEKDPEALEAATVSAVGNAITIAKDTITYNASSFHVSSNAMLGELLSRMPGIEVGKDGSVKVNGESVDRITVGGKTFFFDDTSTAVNNLPAKIVEKVKVIDQAKKDAESSGMVTVNDREKVMDLELKEEYKKGWFGNASVGGGAELVSGSDNPLHDKSHALYTGNLLVAGYNEKDNLTIIANAANVSSGDGVMVVYSDELDLSDLGDLGGGLTTSAQAGANYNTTRIKGFETTATVNYRYSENDRRSMSERTAFQSGAPDLLTKSSSQSNNVSNSVSAGFELSNIDKSKVNIRFEPRFSFSRNSSSSVSESKSTQGGMMQNDSRSNNQSNSNQLSTSGMAKIATTHDNKQYFTLTGHYNFSANNGDSRVFNQTNTLGGVLLKDLLYDNSGHTVGASIDGQYTAQLVDKLKLKMEYDWTFSNSDSNRDASNVDGTVNDYYTSWSKNNYARHRLLTTLQHAFKGTDFYTVGFSTMASLNETRARSLGVTTETGVGDWMWQFAPEAQLSMTGKGTRFNLTLSSAAARPGNSQLSQALNISNPTQISTGNIYLKTFVRNTMQASFSWNDPKTFSYASVSLIGQLTTTPVANASWYDASGIRYFLPVNARKPQAYGTLYMSFSRPFGKEKKSTLSANVNLNYQSNSSYQSLQRQAGMDQNAFDYKTFMAGFWGNADGDLFYAGKSGFSESRTTQFTQGLTLTYALNLNAFHLMASARASHTGSNYSLLPESNTSTWDFGTYFDLGYITDNQWEFVTSPSYRFYRGYMEGYATPELLWDLSINKLFKNYTLSLVVNDILNQHKSFSRSVSAEYIQDGYSNMLGRTVLLKFTYNFGKANAAQSAKARNASYNMMY